jgi:hypothetical protein
MVVDVEQSEWVGPKGIRREQCTLCKKRALAATASIQQRIYTPRRTQEGFPQIQGISMQATKVGVKRSGRCPAGSLSEGLDLKVRKKDVDTAAIGRPVRSQHNAAEQKRKFRKPDLCTGRTGSQSIDHVQQGRKKKISKK